MAASDRINISTLLEWYLQVPERFRSEFNAGIVVSGCILRHFIGNEWIQKNLFPGRDRRGFLAQNPGTPSTPEAYIQSYKAVDLAELLFNLQNIEGFDDCLGRLASTNDPEAIIAELDAARMLFINKHDFRFVVRTQKKKEDYDLELNLEKWTVCVEAKCKVEATALSQETLLNALRTARGQLPSDKPGVIFVKIPPSWKEKFLWRQFMQETIGLFFKSRTGRIVSVIFYVAPYQYSQGILSQGHDIGEVYNGNNRFDSTVKWRLLGRHIPPIHSPNAMPPFWLRLANFPTGIRDYEDPNRRF